MVGSKTGMTYDFGFGGFAQEVAEKIKEDSKRQPAPKLYDTKEAAIQAEILRVLREQGFDELKVKIDSKSIDGHFDKNYTFSAQGADRTPYSGKMLRLATVLRQNGSKYSFSFSPKEPSCLVDVFTLTNTKEKREKVRIPGQGRPVFPPT